jgi:hypothetical protein
MMMRRSNWVIDICATGTHNYAAIIACILVSALAPSLAATSETCSGGDGSPAAVEDLKDMVIV